jgi:hypothetical protein
MDSIVVFEVSDAELAKIEESGIPLVKHINNPKLPDGVSMSDEAKEKGINVIIERKKVS